MGYCSKDFKNVKEALGRAVKIADVVFVFGSLYMYKEGVDNI